jgi:hypothetical protein
VIDRRENPIPREQQGNGGEPELSGDPLRTLSPSDTFGFELIERRIEAVETLLPPFLAEDLPEISLPEGLVTLSGIGSSKAHGEFLAHLLNQVPGYTARVSEIHPDSNPPETEGSRIVFSQGLSANANGIIQQQIRDGAGIVFTAVTERGAADSGKKHVQETYRQMQEAGIDIVTMPLENEYQVLIRTVGPFFGYLAAYKTAQSIAPETFEPLDEQSLLQMLSAAKEKGEAMLKLTSRDELASNVHFVTFPPNTNMLGNLGMKFIEGAFLDRPAVSNIIEFDHGPFQNIARKGGTVFLFHGGSTAESRFANELQNGLRSLHGGSGAPAIEVTSSLPENLQILEFEMIFNHFMLGLMKQGGEACDQIRFTEGSNYTKVL